MSVRLEVGSLGQQSGPASASHDRQIPCREAAIGGRLNPEYTFEKFVEGKSNEMARAAALQVGSNPGRSYNPLFIYGGVGLGQDPPDAGGGPPDPQQSP